MPKCKLIFILFFCLAQTLLWAAPDVTGVTGTLSQGETVTISGSSFGTGPTIYKWDDFEGATHTTGHDIGAGPGSIAWGANFNNVEPQIASGGRLGATDQYVVVTAIAGSVHGFHLDTDSVLSTLYVTYMFKWDQNITSGNCKLIVPANPICPGSYYYYAGPGVGITWQLEYGAVNGDAWIANDDDGDTCKHEAWAQSGISNPSINQWVRGEFFGIESSANQTNGTVIWKMQMSTNGEWETLLNHTGNANTRVEEDEHWRGSVFGRVIGATTSGYDDIYIANSQARVEIGNSSTIATCTHRELQGTINSWSASSISVNINQGSFAAEDAVYVIVVASDGTEDYYGPMQVGGSYPSTPTISGCVQSGGVAR